MKLAELTSLQVADIASLTTVVLPVAATEQHGPHLAVSTDTALVTHVAERAEAALPEDVVLCPTLPFGSSHHHLGFAGTLSLSHQTFMHVLIELVESLLQGGFRRIVLLNGHGGNITPAKQALSILSHRYDDTLQPNIALATYWELGGSAFAGAAPMESPALSHACEYETSMMLHLFPERVRMQHARCAAPPPANEYIAWEEEQPYRGVIMSKRTHFISSSGSSGRPDLATADKGEHLLQQAVENTVVFLKQFNKWELMGICVMGTTPNRKEINHPEKQVATGAYSAGIEIAGWVWVSGQGPLDLRTGEVLHGTVEEETRLTLQHVEKILKEAGCSLNDIVKCTVHLQDIADFDAFNETYREFFREVRPLPARTTVQSVLWGGIKIEIDAVAYRSSNQ